ncbi:response regulator [Paraburkholderia caballeronis]|uniref:response regulator n=1 Tax=Paraburkholderia caballeronis TaxID=416943 RepID=UPI0010650EFF|nr:response regulator [Paraburkholderia caballeronis]TDV03399.1 response regulator receiver domain-containing protein [Paraburkholderia caballeronis]TDV07030.1 response regulator receiver domain-containing protein [Paraburkholderia caballeronis]TDV17069.1 response regulator receiver domain-containing protein [Paraburkholderia caballeronis]
MDARILIADDDEKSITGLSALLAGLGYATEVARTLDAAVATAAWFQPDAAIVAPALSGDDPTATARRLRAACGERAPLLISLTGWGESQHREAALAAGFDVHLVRPVGLDQLTFILSMIG